MDTKGTMGSVRINSVSVLSGLCKLSQKYTFYWSKISKDIKQNININKLNVRYNAQSGHSTVATSHDENSENETVLLTIVKRMHDIELDIFR